MRTRLVGAATVAALAAGALATTGVFGSSHREAPRIMLDPAADNTDVYAFMAPDAPGQADRRRQLDPAGRPGRRAVLRQARSRGALLRQDRQHRRRRRGRRATAGSSRTGSATRTRSCTRSRRSTRSATRTSTSSRPTTSTTSATAAGKPRLERRIARNVPGRARQRRAEDDAQLRRASPTAPSRESRGGGKTFVGPVDDPFFVDLGAVFDGINIDKPGRPVIGLGNQGGGKDDVAGYNMHAFVLQVPESEVTRDGRAVSGREGGQRGRRRLGDHRAAARSRSTAPATASRPLGAGQPPRQPADQRGRSSRSGRRTSTTPRAPRPTPKNFGAVRAEPRAGEDPQRAVQPRHQGEQPHGHRPGAADRRPRADADLARGRPRRHAEGQPRRAAGGEPEPLRRARR